MPTAHASPPRAATEHVLVTITVDPPRGTVWCSCSWSHHVHDSRADETAIRSRLNRLHADHWTAATTEGARP